VAAAAIMACGFMGKLLGQVVEDRLKEPEAASGLNLTSAAG
jgi:hypothetical protein